jgi:hypothetical protein
MGQSGSSPDEKLSFFVGAAEAVGRCEAAFHKSAVAADESAIVMGLWAE